MRVSQSFMLVEQAFWFLCLPLKSGEVNSITVLGLQRKTWKIILS